MKNRSVIWKRLGVEYNGCICNVYLKKDKVKVDVIFESGEWIIGVPFNSILKNSAWKLNDYIISETVFNKWVYSMSNNDLVFVVRVRGSVSTRFISVKANNITQAKDSVSAIIKQGVVDSIDMSKCQISNMHHNLIQAV
jgi:hypothetical protein